MSTAVVVRMGVGGATSPKAVIRVRDSVPFTYIKIPWRVRFKVLVHGRLQVQATAFEEAHD